MLFLADFATWNCQVESEKFMRIMVMFDVPVRTKDERKKATKFRNNLLKQGYFMMQFSVYLRIVRGISAANSAVERLKLILPPKGNIRALIVTEKQFDNMKLLLGNNDEQMEKSRPVQLLLFDDL